MKEVSIAGVRFIQHDDGRYELVDDVKVFEKTTDCISYTIFENHSDRYDVTYVMGEWVWNGCQRFHISEIDEVFNTFGVPPLYKKDIRSALSLYDPLKTGIDALMTADYNYTKMLSLCGLVIGTFTATHCEYLHKTGGVVSVVEFLKKHHHLNTNTVEKYFTIEDIAENIELFDGIDIPVDVLILLEPDVNKQIRLCLEHHKDVYNILYTDRDDVSSDTMLYVLNEVISNGVSRLDQTYSTCYLICRILIERDYQFTAEERKHIATNIPWPPSALEKVRLMLGQDIKSIEYLDTYCDMDFFIMLVTSSPYISEVSMKTIYDEIVSYESYPYFQKLIEKTHPYVLD